jgi:hypothetical protein
MGFSFQDLIRLMAANEMNIWNKWYGMGRLKPLSGTQPSGRDYFQKRNKRAFAGTISEW